MQENAGFEDVKESFFAMTPEAAAKYREIGQTLAELYPQPMTIELVKSKPDKNVELLREFGELSPAGLCLIDWNTRLIAWTNGAYKRVFLDAVGKESKAGVRVGDLVPEFAEQGLEALFDAVASTRQPFMASSYPLRTGTVMTYWDCSLSAFPSTDGANYLFLQLQRVHVPAQSLAA